MMDRGLVGFSVAWLATAMMAMDGFGDLGTAGLGAGLSMWSPMTVVSIPMKMVGSLLCRCGFWPMQWMVQLALSVRHLG